MPGRCGPARSRAIANGTPAIDADTVSVIEPLEPPFNVVTIGQGGPSTAFQVADADGVFGCWAPPTHVQRRRTGTRRRERIRGSYTVERGLRYGLAEECGISVARFSAPWFRRQQNSRRLSPALEPTLDCPRRPERVAGRRRGIPSTWRGGGPRPEAILLTVLADSAPDQPRHRDRGIYVETLVRGSIDELWSKTQEPDLHERWDLRFTSIEFLAGESTEAVRRFRYATRIGFGMNVAGRGETSTETSGSSGERTSALRFWSQDPKSLIEEGSGYWRYIPTSDGIRFLTWYSYRARFGVMGRALDGAVFRPLLGWATAWSFDRLPALDREGDRSRPLDAASVSHAIARVTLAFVLVYHGLIPKILCRDSLEDRLVEAAGIAREAAPSRHGRWGRRNRVRYRPSSLLARPHRSRARIVFMFVSVVAVAVTAPDQLTRAFSPVTLNAACAALAASPPLRTGPAFRLALSARPPGNDRALHLSTCARIGLRQTPPRDPETIRVQQRGWTCVDRHRSDGRDLARRVLHASVPVPRDRGAASCFPSAAARSHSRSRTTPTSTRSAGRPSPGSAHFETRRPRRFDAYMIYSEQRAVASSTTSARTSTSRWIWNSRWTNKAGCASVRASSASTRVRSAFKFPMCFSGIAEVREWYDDAAGMFRIEVNVHNRTWGPLFGYRGSFAVEWRTIGATVPPDRLPVRTERRE